jgi:hypothetical protein
MSVKIALSLDADELSILVDLFADIDADYGLSDAEEILANKIRSARGALRYNTGPRPLRADALDENPEDLCRSTNSSARNAVYSKR